MSAWNTNLRFLRIVTQFIYKFSFSSIVFRHFDYQNLTLVQNKHDIRNQHSKLHPATSVLSKNILYQNLTRIPPRRAFPKFLSVVPYGSNFGKKNVSININYGMWFAMLIRISCLFRTRRNF